jgi:hypothetical protein
MNHRFLLRLVTNLSIFLLALTCFGAVLWVIDNFLLWDILPEAWSPIVAALLVTAGIVAFVMVVMNLLLSLALVAESNASRADLPNYGVSQQLKRRVNKSIGVGIVAIALLIGGLQITDHFRNQAATKASEAEFIQAQSEINSSLDQVLDLFTAPLIEAIETNTLTEKGQLSSLTKLSSAVQSSFPNSPIMALVLPAPQPPYKYMRIDSSSISASSGKTVLSPKLFSTFPNKTETQAIEQLFAGKLPAITEPLSGQVINNTVPSAWGLLKSNGKIIAVVYLQSEYYQGIATPDAEYSSGYSDPAVASSTFHHNGPEALISN